MHEHYNVTVTRVIDGDTFVGDVHHHVFAIEYTLKDQYFRLNGLNAPEVRGEEKEKGLISKRFVEEQILNQTVQVEVHGKEKYGRWLVSVFIGPVNLNQQLIHEGLAERRTY